MFFSYFVKKFTRKVVGDFNNGQDPFVEEYEFERKSFFSGSSKVVKKTRPKSIAEYVPERQRGLVLSMRKRCYRMELMFSFWGMKFGWLNIVKIVPVVGDICALCLSLLVLREMRTAADGLPSDIMASCLFNILIDFTFSLVPIVGDIVSVAYKPNCRNAMLIEEHIDRKYRKEMNLKAAKQMDTPISAAKQH
ncbi:hypothetical protein HG536_0E00530 [Torulaspora globosa]|uniref:DUF4112 domain-containing protein n=1 Tax=Torulaspora globosa TaxID=48254 RepID=A0A7G3ZI07_9SACH|nr:uncharacterized protein HG536_0E00530 [Torulaspora globosa]QLL33143.1 hypothetical protein HG536_0E00530 [Torulaspora globosa]